MTHMETASEDNSTEVGELPDHEVDAMTPTSSRPLRSRTWFSMGAGAVLVLVGAAAPWFVVGPASRLGVADDGWPCLIAVIAMLVGVVGARVTGGSAWLAAVAAGSVLAIGAVAFALATPPEAMSVSAGPFISLIGAFLAAAGAVVAWRVLESEPVAEDESASSSPRTTSPIGSVVRWTGWVGAGLMLIVLALASWPIDIDQLGSNADPTDSYESALARFEEVTRSEPDFVFEPCRSQLLDHGERTETVVVLFHGLTNCPRQYQEIAESLHDQGASVVLLRAPGHGHATSDGGQIAGAGALHSLTARQLADYGDDAIDIAVGLGDDVRVHGLSMGGVISLWAAQYRPDVDRVVAMAPAFELPVVPNAVSNAFTNLFARTPSITRSHDRRIDHDYAAFSSRGLAAAFALGQAVMDDGLDIGPIVDDVTVLLNPDDPLVHESDIEALVAAWDRTRNVVDVIVLDTVDLPHDAIDLAQPKADPDEVYPVVFEALGYEWPS